MSTVLKEEVKPCKVENDGTIGAVEMEGHGSSLLSPRELIRSMGSFNAKGGSCAEIRVTDSAA